MLEFIFEINSYVLITIFDFSLKNLFYHLNSFDGEILLFNALEQQRLEFLFQELDHEMSTLYNFLRNESVKHKKFYRLAMQSDNNRLVEVAEYFFENNYRNIKKSAVYYNNNVLRYDNTSDYYYNFDNFNYIYLHEQKNLQKLFHNHLDLTQKLSKSNFFGPKNTKALIKNLCKSKIQIENSQKKLYSFFKLYDE